jgi:hypothetical protein
MAKYFQWTLGALFLLQVTARAQTTTGKPNIVSIMADDLGWGARSG